MASKHTTKKRTLRGRSETCSRSIARRLKYLTPEFDADQLQREIGGAR